MRGFFLLFITPSVILLSTEQKDPFLCNTHVRLVHKEGEIMGLSHGYSSISFFLTQKKPIRSARVYADIRGHMLNNGKPAANAGFGVRLPVLDNKLVLGGHLFYDFRKSVIHRFQQIGMGIEFLGKEVDVRFSGALPVGRQSHRKQVFFPDRIEENGRASFGHFDMEIGKKVEGWVKPLEAYCAFGAYHLFKARLLGKSFANGWGARLRMSVRPLPKVRLGVEGSWDHQFKKRFMATISLGSDRSVSGCGEDCMESKICDFSPRREIVPTVKAKRSRQTSTPAPISV